MASPEKQGAPVAVQPSPSRALNLRASAKLTSAWVESDIIDVRDSRITRLDIAYQGATGTVTGAYAWIRLFTTADDRDMSGEAQLAQRKVQMAPTVATDVWYAPGILDAVPTDAIITGAGPTGATFTIEPSWREYTVGPMILRTFALTSPTTDRIRMSVNVRVDSARWLYAAAIEKGNVTNPGTLGVRYSLSF